MSTPKKSQKSQKKQVKDGGELNGILSALALTVGAIVARKKHLAFPSFEGGNVHGNASSYTSSGSSLTGGATQKKTSKRKSTKRGGEGEGIPEPPKDSETQPDMRVMPVATTDGGARRRPKSSTKKGLKRGGEALTSLTSPPPEGGSLPGMPASTGPNESPFIQEGSGKRSSKSRQSSSRKQGGVNDISELLKSLRKLN